MTDEHIIRLSPGQSSSFRGGANLPRAGKNTFFFPSPEKTIDNYICIYVRDVYEQLLNKIIIGIY